MQAKSKQGPNKGWKKKDFVRYELDEALKAACKAQNLDVDALDDAMLRLADEQYSFKVSWDAYNSCHQCLLQTDDDGSPNADLILVGRGSTPLKALKQVLFKHYHALDGVWPHPEFSRQPADWDD